jgi:membrane-associated HD superfamily phosphohydrolase
MDATKSPQFLPAALADFDGIISPPGGLLMPDQIKRGRTLSLILLGMVTIIFVVNVFYPLYLSPPDQSRRISVLFLMLALVALAYLGVPSIRAIISVVLFLFALIDSLVLFSTLADHRFALSLLIGSIMTAFLAIGSLLLWSKSVRAYEANRRKRPA